MDLPTTADDSPVNPPTTVTLPLRFHGSGAEYFRIWIVNLLLTLVTLGFYYPWAKVRRLKYFYNHTLLAEHGFEFHGVPRAMLRGMAMVGVLFFLYSFASEFSPVAGLIAALAVTGLWPFLWRTAIRFRLANTSWRGLRFAFVGNVRGAIIAAGIPTALLLVPLAVAAFWMLGDVPEESQEMEAEMRRQGMITLGIFLPWLLALPWFLWFAERYRRGAFRYAQIATEFSAGAGAIYLLALRLVGVLLGGVLLLTPVAVLAAVFAGSDATETEDLFAALKSARFVFGMTLFGLAYLVMILLVRAYAVARLQNLLWSHTHAPSLTIHSRLRFRSTLGLMLKNWLLVLLSLGLYWPFAAVALWRLRIEAISLDLAVPLETLVGSGTGGESESAGEMAADLADFDFGW